MKAWKWCPTADCPYMARGETFRRVINCWCGNLWCFDCTSPTIHFPITCSQLQKYRKLNFDANMTKKFEITVQFVETKYETVDTKSCPKCHVPWWKNGGNIIFLILFIYFILNIYTYTYIYISILFFYFCYNYSDDTYTVYIILEISSLYYIRLALVTTYVNV